ncbi:GntR family transcriptional regulator [Bhargavaea cecembensis]|uniref:GntR family transcriptional regulator n=1 Tax=Bhargavaea cecembensis TaxID=394098 RepID=A0A161RBM8_9BACL|nr:GntR family transcriptional regulator [Bhargavaea cecembensis]KZE36842.1 GntR family transcriptional regulator [Bhargavaea cecembensis]
MPLPTQLSKPVRMTAKETAFNQVQNWIIDGTLRPGEKLNDMEIAKALGVSRTPVRESLQLLETQGFVKMYPGKATQVTEIDPDAINDLLPPLAVLQALSAELAIPHLTDEIISRLTETNERFGKAIREGDELSAIRIDEEFHQIIVEAAGNPYITSIVGNLQAHVRRHFYHDAIVLREQSYKEHSDIIRSMMEGDAGKVTGIMTKNWLTAIEELRALRGQ